MADFKILPARDVADAFEPIAREHGGALMLPSLRNYAVETWAILDEDGRVFGGFNLEVIRLKSVKTLTVPEFHPHCALFCLPMEGSLVSVQTRKKKLITEIASFLKSRKEPIMEITFPSSWIDMQPFIWAGFHCTVKYTYQFDLSGKELESRFSAKLRNSIKKAVKEEVEVDKGDKEELLSCLLSSSKNGGFDLNESQVISIIDAAGAAGRIDVARHQGKVIAGAFSIVDDSTEYYLFGGADRKSNVGGSLAYILQQKMIRSQEEGRALFDFEGSMIQGVERFFRDFGGTLTPYFQITKAPNWAIPLLRMRGRNEF